MKRSAVARLAAWLDSCPDDGSADRRVEIEVGVHQSAHVVVFLQESREVDGAPRFRDRQGAGRTLAQAIKTALARRGRWKRSP